MRYKKDHWVGCAKIDVRETNESLPLNRSPGKQIQRAQTCWEEEKDLITWEQMILSKTLVAKLVSFCFKHWIFFLYIILYIGITQGP